MLKDEIERTLREFIPHSVEYCISDLAKMILESVKKCIPEKITKADKKNDGDRIQGYNQAIAEIKQKIK